MNRILIGAFLFAIAASSVSAQPSACTTAWTTFNPTVGPSGPVGGALIVHDGRLIMRGAILSAGGVPISNRVAMWDGMTWTDISQGFTLDPLLNNTANCMVSLHGNVYSVGELIVSEPPNTYRHPGLFWNGQVWQRIPRTGLRNGRSFFFYATGGKLYSRGVFGFADANGNTAFTKSLAVWDGAGAWQTVGPADYDIPNGVGSIVERQSVFQSPNKVFVAGSFTRVDHQVPTNPQHIPVNNIAVLENNTWSNAGTGVNAVASLIEFNDTLYAYGDFTASGDGAQPLNRFARWSGSSWIPVGPGAGVGFSARPVHAFVGDDSRGPAIFFWHSSGNTALNVAPGYPPTVVSNGLVRFDGVGFTIANTSGSATGINGYTSGTLRHSDAAVYAALNNTNLGTGGPGHFARLGRDQEIDTDGDGIPDEWERPGGGLDVNCDGVIDLNLWALGASDQHKDLFIEIDAMTGLAPNSTAMTLVREAFDNAPVSNPDGFNGIRVHMGVDEDDIPVDYFPNGLVGLRLIKSNHFGTADDRSDPNAANILEAKRRVYRYALFASSFGNLNECGLAELPGNDFMVTLNQANWGDVATPNAQAATFMHMLGHTLGLRHGGGQHDPAAPHRYNFKPNFHSIMNFSWQFPGRAGWTLDYSRRVLPVLDELFLGEYQGIEGDPDALAIIGPPPCRFVAEEGQIDYDRDGAIDLAHVMLDINRVCACVPESWGDRLEGFIDWAALRLNFRATAGYLDGGGTVTTVGDEMTYLIYQALQGCTTPTCLADFDDGSGTGTPDGGVTIDDLLYFMIQFDLGNARTDIDDGSGTGTPDGGVTIDDLLYFLQRFDRGC